jgi:hypothetical protein
MAVLLPERIAEMLFSTEPDKFPRSANLGSLQAVQAAVDADPSLDLATFRFELIGGTIVIHGSATAPGVVDRAIATAKAVTSLPVVRPMF